MEPSMLGPSTKTDAEIVPRGAAKTGSPSVTFASLLFPQASRSGRVSARQGSQHSDKQGREGLILLPSASAVRKSQKFREERGENLEPKRQSRKAKGGG